MTPCMKCPGGMLCSDVHPCGGDGAHTIRAANILPYCSGFGSCHCVTPLFETRAQKRPFSRLSSNVTFFSQHFMHPFLRCFAGRYELNLSATTMLCSRPSTSSSKISTAAWWTPNRRTTRKVVRKTTLLRTRMTSWQCPCQPAWKMTNRPLWIFSWPWQKGTHPYK